MDMKLRTSKINMESSCHVPKTFQYTLKVLYHGALYVLALLISGTTHKVLFLICVECAVY